MEDNHTHIIREVCKFLSGIIAADIVVGLWAGFGQTNTNTFFGISFTQTFIGIWLILDVILLALLLHYGWNMQLPLSKPRKVFFVVVGCILSLVSAAHVLRIFYAVPVVIGTFVAPFWLSIIGALVAGFLAYASFHFARRA